MTDKRMRIIKNEIEKNIKGKLYLLIFGLSIYFALSTECIHSK